MAAESLSPDLDSGENFSWCKKHFIQYFWLGSLIVVGYGGVVKESRHIILYLIEGSLDHVSRGRNEGVDLAVGALADFQENDGAFADDLIDDEC